MSKEGLISILICFATIGVFVVVDGLGQIINDLIEYCQNRREAVKDKKS